MVDVNEMFWDASLEELKRGYVFDQTEKSFVCLICGDSFEKGRVFPDDGAFYEAEAFASVHLQNKHGSMFEYLLNLNKKITGLTDHQKNLLGFFYQGLNDAAIVKELGGGSASTVRNHRFTLREKEKQAKVFLAIMELIGSKSASPKQKFIPVHRTASMLDERYAITEEENEAILQTYFPEGPDGPLKEFPKKEKRKLAILKHILKRFDKRKKYTEKEVNQVIQTAYPDYATLRRSLIEYGFMDRQEDGSAYWVKH